MTDKQIAIAYFEEAIHSTTTGNWQWDKGYIDRLAGRDVDTRALNDTMWELFGDYLLDEGDVDGLDCMIGGQYCEYMNPEGLTLEEYETLIWTEYWVSFDTEEEAKENMEQHIKAYKECLEYIEQLKGNAND